jgi:catechol 2,3-dioxygenase-like lactoylglutathione lyase family enzyme
MKHGSPVPAVLQLRLVVETEEFEAALAFYRDALGLSELAAFEGAGDARVVILDAGRATLEIVNPAQRTMIDEIEVGHDASPKIRVAFEVVDARATTASLTSSGANLIGGPVETPWKSLNSRLDAPAGLQITVFQQLTSPRGT